MDNLIAIKTNCYQGFSFQECLKGLKQAGFHYVEISASPKGLFGLTRKTDTNQALKIKQQYLENGLIPISLGASLHIMDENNLEAFIDSLKMAKLFGCQYLVSSVGKVNGNAMQEINELVKNKILTILPYLEEYQITMVIELHDMHNNAAILSNLCKLVDSPYVRINYDTANAIFLNGATLENLTKDVESCLPYLSYLHLKEKAGGLNEWNFPALGQGYLPLKDIIKTLDKHQNNSVLCCEIEFTAEPVKDVEEVNMAVKNSANFLKQCGCIL